MDTCTIMCMCTRMCNGLIYNSHIITLMKKTKLKKSRANKGISKISKKKKRKRDREENFRKIRALS